MTPRLVLTLGDPSGIGPEIVLKALAAPPRECEIAIVGSRSRLEISYASLRDRTTDPLANPDKLNLIDLPLAPEIEANLCLGLGNQASGTASFAYLERALSLTVAGEFHGIVTAPIAKSAWKAAGHFYPGQTEVLARGAGVDRFGMMFVARSPHTDWRLRVLLATTHIPLEQVTATLNARLLSDKLDLLAEALHQDFGIESPCIAISGLNPHSGEGGQLGTEERDWLIPWLERTRDRRPELQLVGPVPPDTMWVKPGRAWYRDKDTPGVADAYLALYHDRGLIPVKLMAFEQAINTTIGLPFVRTSPDHGRAFDIAGKGIADASSFEAAIELAIAAVKPHRSSVPSSG